jgi:RNA binding exosome subunit
MPLDDTFLVTRPNQQNSTGSEQALIIEEFTGMVEGTLARKSQLKGWVNVRPVKGTSTIRDDAVGESTIQVLQPNGATVDSTRSDFAKNTLTIDTVVLARATFPILEVFQTNFDKRREVASEHGKILGKLWDEAMFIQALRTSLLAESAFDKGAAGAKPQGHFGGNIETLAAALDATDPAKLYAAIARLLVKMEDKDVDPQSDDCILALKAAQFYTLLQAEQLINGEYITAEGNKVKGMILAAYGIPVVRSNNYPAGKNVTAHPLSTALNGNAYNGDFTKAVATVFSPRALLAGETIPLTTEIFYDNVTKLHFVDAHMAYGATSRRAEMSGSIYAP